MVVVEIIGSISLAIALVSAIVLAILYMKHKQNPIRFISNHPVNNNEQSEMINHQSWAILPFKEFKNEQSSIHVIKNEENPSSSSRNYGIQWSFSSKDESKVEIIHSISSHHLQTMEFEHGDSFSSNDQTISVRNLIEKFENNLNEKISEKEKTHPTDSDLTSMDTNFDNQTIQTDFNPNETRFSHHSSISNLDVTIPSNLSSSIDLEQFDCTSTTSNFSEVFNQSSLH